MKFFQVDWQYSTKSYRPSNKSPNTKPEKPSYKLLELSNKLSKHYRLLLIYPWLSLREIPTAKGIRHFRYKTHMI